jgi:hypothetical protein
LERTVGWRDAYRSAPTAAFTKRHLHHALNWIARRLEQRSPAPDDYDAERRRILQANARSWQHRRLTAADIPTATQLRTIAGSWNEALVIAGLSKRVRARVYAIPTRLALEVWLEVTGGLPTYHTMRKFHRKLDQTFARVEDGYIETCRALAESRRARGLWTPTGTTEADSSIFELTAEQFAEADRLLTERWGALCQPLGIRYLKRRTNPWTHEEVIAGLRKFLDALGPDQRPTQKTYRAMLREDRDWPSIGTTQSHGNGKDWSELLEEARKLK